MIFTSIACDYTDGTSTGLRGTRGKLHHIDLTDDEITHIDMYTDKMYPGIPLKVIVGIDVTTKKTKYKVGAHR